MKIKWNKIWATCGQVIFAMFIIIALYAIAFKAKDSYGNIRTGWETPTKGDGITGNPVYGLSISAIVIAFVGIIMPSFSLFVDNKKLNFFMGWTTIILDIIAMALLTAALAEYAQRIKEQNTPLGLTYRKGYLAGQFIMDFVGFGIALAGLCFSYKNDLKKMH